MKYNRPEENKEVRLITVESLSKSFDDFSAVKEVSFQVGKGQVLGLLGPNGAGKSTTMRMLTGFIHPTSGNATICGYSILHEKELAQAHIGYVPENAPLYDDMDVREFLEFIYDLRGLASEQKKNRVQEILKLCVIEEVELQKIETLSKGYKRRVSLAQALIHNPDVLILDEPTDGLDPNQKHEVRKVIKNLSKEKTIVISTHILEEVDAVCDRAIIMSHGRICFDGTPAALKAQSPTGKLDDIFRTITQRQEALC
ncbi:MAG: multidrug ABC transporter ATP-binding protein [Bdellovibrionales bacterium GWA2_49_15]|nr:MAG: multidrug ABC transporter ATP-binding protein [Bdellovibrionales bacterium GWA2_49_15]